MGNSPYLIRCIRLINFHNFTDETITLEDGGHLFLLGDNGCGKTTILDAVHYALTAGMAMEWNSAARVTGYKQHGRRVQGIVLRYNLDTGIMNKNGAITYVALEIIGRHGRPLTIGMGISATAMDERIRFWGVIRECSLGELSFLTEEDGRLRPSSRQEFKQQLGSGHGFFSNQAGYRREIAERLFGGGESYQDICRFLAMGKAYREISAGAADYHALFKRLLPEPRTAIFEQIINALRTLDESQTILDDLDRKLIWLGGLHNIIEIVAEQRQGLIRYDWLLCNFSITRTENEQLEISSKIADGIKQLLSDQAKLADLYRHDRELEERLDNLKAKDATGLIRQEKSCQVELAEKKVYLKQEKQSLKNRLSQLRSSEKESIRLQDHFRQMLTRSLPEFATRATALPFSINALQADLDQLSRSEEPFVNFDFNTRQCIEQCDHHLQNGGQEIALLKQQEAGLNEAIEKQQKTVQDLEQQSEIFPDLNNYQELLRIIQHKMLNPRPLYLGLEWLTTVTKKQQQYIEECIGEEILSTLLFREIEYSAANCNQLQTVC